MSTSPAPDSPERMTAQEATDYYRQRVDDWAAFEAAIVDSDAELDAWLAAGNEGLPPGYVTAREYLHRGV